METQIEREYRLSSDGKIERLGRRLRPGQRIRTVVYAPGGKKFIVDRIVVRVTSKGVHVKQEAFERLSFLDAGSQRKAYVVRKQRRRSR